MSKSNRWFQPHDGIAREVISADIQRYLGRDALVRPGVHEGQEGYWITAYRNLTSEMVRDLQQDSLRWRAEQQQGQQARRGGSRAAAAPEYKSSMTHQSRQYYGPTETPAPTMDSPYAPPPTQDQYGGVRESYGQQGVRTSAGYGVQPGYTQTAGYPQAQGYSHAQTGYAEAAYQSPQSAYSTQSYTSSTAATHPAGPGGYANASPPHQYVHPQSGNQYVTSTTPQSFDGTQQVPRTAAGGYAEGYQQPSSATAADSFAGYRTGPSAASQGYSYQQGVPGNASREQVYSSGHATAPTQTRYFTPPRSTFSPDSRRRNVDIWLDNAKPLQQ